MFKTNDPRLKRLVPSDFKHVEKFPLTAPTTPPAPVPVTAGVNWYSDFDRPQLGRDGRWYIGRNPKNLGYLRGGHCVCIPHTTTIGTLTGDSSGWYHHYDQVNEGACVGMGASRMMSLINRETYDAFWLWDRAKEIDEWNDTNPGDNNGTSVRAAMDVLRFVGHTVQGARIDADPAPEMAHGIIANRWATSIDQVLTATGHPWYRKNQLIPFLNSWGRHYPRLVFMPAATWHRLLMEDGEFTIITDR